jgi:hypothetical protein
LLPKDGQDIPETVLQFDVTSRSLSLGEEKTAADLQAFGEAILEFLRGTDEPKTETEIDGGVEGKTGQKRKALRALVTQGKVSREGVGRKGDPYRYRFSFPCSPYIPGTREQELEKWPDTRINTGDILVPDAKIWNRMSSGSYFPPPVRAVSIPKKSGGQRILGGPTVADRVAQMVVEQVIEPILDPIIFLADSYGYRPRKSALDAVGVTRERCWKYDWVLEFDINRKPCWASGKCG